MHAAAVSLLPGPLPHTHREVSSRLGSKLLLQQQQVSWNQQLCDMPGPLQPAPPAHLNGSIVDQHIDLAVLVNHLRYKVGGTASTGSELPGPAGRLAGRGIEAEAMQQQ